MARQSDRSGEMTTGRATVERIVLVGAGDHGRGALEILRRARSAGRSCDVVGVVDDAADARPLEEVPLLGTTAWLAENLPALDVFVILAIAAPAPKKRIAALLNQAGARWTTAVHPTADLAPSVVVGPGSIVNTGVIVVHNTRIGAHVTLNLHATVGHDITIGDHTTVAPGAVLLGRVQIGEGCMINANSVILPSVKVGAGSVVGAGAVVLQDVPPGVTVFGNPARVVPLFKQA